jgi:Right handed beta helix region/Protein of unknown function (DUF1565)
MTMSRLSHAITICALAAASFLTGAVHAATYHVATTGSDSNPGTEKQPWRTVAKAVNAMVAGDTTYVRGGTYNEGLIQFRTSGSQSAPIKLLNYPDESPVIECIDPTKFHRMILQHASGTHNAIGWITIEGFEIRNCWDGIKMHSGHDITIRRNWIHHNPNQGILGNGTRVWVDRNIISHNGPFITKPTAIGAHGMYGNGTAWTITNNLIYDNLGFGIQQNGSNSSIYNPEKHPGPEFAVSANWIVANNTIAYQHNAGGMVVWGSTCNNVRIENNIFYENAASLSAATQGVHFTSTKCTGVVIKNNLFYASGSGGTKAFGSGATEGMHYTQSDNIVTSNPNFVNAPATLPSSPNFALTARSPAIDAGRFLDITRIAIDGTLRPQGRAYDIGAYEYTPHADAQSPSAPRALQID